MGFIWISLFYAEHKLDILYSKKICVVIEAKAAIFKVQHFRK